ncbi:hypothetical protein WGC32_14120 [Zongyangia sp. HA2173]|uniref:hypothetical protein n=1 Tax=Zongyangia sp. HA2173 TaxID=3133035 RepID=UPI003165A788
METMQFDKMVEKYRQELLTMAAKQKNSQWPLSASEREAPQQPKISEDNVEKRWEQKPSLTVNMTPVITGESRPNTTGENGSENQQQVPERSSLQNSKEAGTDPIEETMTYGEFLERNPHWGLMKIQAFTGRGTMPVEGVEISIDRNFTDGPRNFYRLTTDADGIIDHINLPTPDKNLSQHPESEQPFATYNVTATHPNYHQQVFKNTPVFEGIKSILPIRLIPKELPQE